jgi:protein required for attachment to host cells
MAEQTDIAHNALVLVGDGRRALFLRNVGYPRRIKLELVRLLEHDTRRNQDIAADRPGRVMGGKGPAHNTLAETDWHHLEESRFVHSVAGAIARSALEDSSLQVVIVMPPKSLGYFRGGLDANVRKHIAAEIRKDLAGLPASDIEHHLQTWSDSLM